MNSSDDDEKRIQQLRERRSRIATQRELNEKRAKYGASVVARLNTVLISRLTLASFDVDGRLPVEFLRTPNFADCSGQVAAHISESMARRLAKCADSQLGTLCGVMGFDEYRFVGVTRIGPVTCSKLLDAAKILHDSVLFCPDGTESIILLDHYEVSGIPTDVGFSIVVQGPELEAKLSNCFESTG